jgi:hypothetical protein
MAPPFRYRIDPVKDILRDLKITQDVLGFLWSHRFCKKPVPTFLRAARATMPLVDP